jgi:glyceraldehyde 3-phosphate dehydrogenase
MAGVLRVTDEELVSADYNGSPYSAVIDAPACAELNPQVGTTSLLSIPMVY